MTTTAYLAKPSLCLPCACNASRGGKIRQPGIGLSRLGDLQAYPSAREVIGSIANDNQGHAFNRIETMSLPH